MTAAGERSGSFAPARGLTGEARVPADKSISHRAAMVGAISESPVEIRNFLRADDTNSTLNALAACGVRIENLTGSEPVVHGAGLRGLQAPAETIDIGNSGTSIRLLPGIFAGQRGSFVLDGDPSIRRRPMDRIVKPLRGMGVDITAEGGRFAPLLVTGGPVHGITYELPVASAQVKSAILLAGLFADGPTTVIEPAVCRDHTEIMLAQAGARVEKDGLKTTVYPARRLHLDQITVPADFSSAAFFLVAATIVPGSSISLPAVGTNPTRTGLIDIMERMGADIEMRPAPGHSSGEPVSDLRVRAATLSGVEVGGDITGRAIDELPLVALLGAFADGDTVVSGAAELKVKESDRIAGLVSNLAAIGVDIEATEDGFIVHGGAGVEGGIFKSMGDHRLAMLGAIAGLGSRTGVEVIGFACVSVSFQGYAAALNGLTEGGA
jgi:3-phosphoshikimate 1-carboxyvinyltransferase